jgi:hypothetical protein
VRELLDQKDPGSCQQDDQEDKQSIAFGKGEFFQRSSLQGDKKERPPANIFEEEFAGGRSNGRKSCGPGYFRRPVIL